MGWIKLSQTRACSSFIQIDPSNYMIISPKHVLPFDAMENKWDTYHLGCN